MRYVNHTTIIRDSTDFSLFSIKRVLFLHTLSVTSKVASNESTYMLNDVRSSKSALYLHKYAAEMIKKHLTNARIAQYP